MDSYRTITPYLVVNDVERQVKFLQDLFGAVEVLSVDRKNGVLVHAEVRVGDSLVMLGRAGDAAGVSRSTFYIWGHDVDEGFRRAVAGGATAERAPADQQYGHRNAGVVDADGNRWWLAQPVVGS